MAPATDPPPAIDPTTGEQPPPATRWAVWFGFLAAPIAWLVHLAAASALVPVACEIDNVLVVHLTTVVTAAVAVAGIIVAHRHRSGARTPASFLAATGFWLGILFLALILLEGLPVLALEPCG